MRLCEFTDCNNKHYGKGYCDKHYWQQYERKPCAPEYSSWLGIKTRCSNANEPSWKNYGARGITMYAEWTHDYPAFLKYVGKRPSPKHSIDRIDNNGNYEPGNLRWATRLQQNTNKRNSNSVPGVSYDNYYHKWSSRLIVDGKLVLNKMSDTYIEAVQCRKDKELELGILL